MAQTHDHTTQSICPACNFGPFTRNNYFTGKLLVERDFTDETRFHMEKLRHHEQQLHGWGVVCGLKVKPHPAEACRDRFVCIEPGYAVDCCGHDIIVREEECVDLTQFKEIQELKKQNDDQPHTLQICVSFRECPTEEIPVLYDDCGCDDTKCAPNRILESYEVGVMLDPKAEPQMLHSPKLKWEHTVNIGHAARVALHDTTHRLYVLTADAPGVVYQLGTANHTTITSRNLPARGLALAVSNNGERVYVVTEPVAPSTVRQLHVLDVTKPGLPSINTNPLDVPNSTGSDVVLTVAPDGRLLALVTVTGDVVRWETGIDSQAVPAAGTVIKNLGTNLKAMALSSDGNVLYVAGAPNTLQALDLTTLNVTAINNVLPAGANVSALATVESTGPDALAVANQTDNRLYLVAPSLAKLIGSVGLEHAPVALAVSPGGHWVYVLEQDTAANESYVQAVNAQGVRQGLTVNASPKFKVGHPSQQLMLNEGGTRLYIPFTGALATLEAGGVALVDVTEQACSEILWRHLEGCPHCDVPNCVVLATIENYHVGDRFWAQTDPPDPQDDPANKIARIDNRQGRRLLPSTQVLQELIECLLEHGTGGGGTQGPPGPQGPAGPGVNSASAETILPNQPADADFDPATGNIHFKIPKGDKGDPGTPGGPGLDDVTLQLVACGQQASATIVTQPGGERVLNLIVPSGCIPVALTHLCDISWRHGEDTAPAELREKGLIIAFDRLVQSSDLHRHSLRVLRERREDDGQVLCWCEVPIRIVPGNLQEHCNVNSGFTASGNPTVNAVQIRFDPPLFQVGEYRVTVSGDLIRDEENKAIDANHLPPWFNTAPYHTGDGVEGGTFESWFRII